MQHLKYLHFCPKCGKPTDYNVDRNGLCIDCYLESHKHKIPREIRLEMTVCVGCGKIKYGNTWYDGNQENIKMIVKRLLRKTPLKVYDYTITLNYDESENLANYEDIKIPTKIYKGAQIIVNKQIDIKINKALCPLCSKKSSGKYYESVIHLRYSRSDEKKLFGEINAFVENFMKSETKLETIDIKKEGAHGIVIRYSSKKVARRFLSALNKKFSIIILRHYREPILINLASKQMRITVEKFFVKVLSP